MSVAVVHVQSASHWAEARRLVEEYAASLTFDLAFQDFDREVRSLETEYGPPTGRFVLAASHDAWIGCGGIRRFSDTECEMKRLYVRPSFRDRGAGRAIALALIAAAREAGYRRMLLDTTPSMAAAHQLYTSLGFTSSEPYRYNPIAGASFWQLQLPESRDPLKPLEPLEPLEPE
ncbi:MAG TPA: GNAT family N-acetyltransferase [Vicinamibacterales bacterium]|nr:GNAT family N-acetyltransferase [Vicinamibacterales bacterium]